MQFLRLPDRRQQHWLEALPEMLNDLEAGSVVVNCGDWLMRCSDLMRLQRALLGRGVTIAQLHAFAAETIVSASALGLSVHPCDATSPIAAAANDSRIPDLLFHQGTLRSGDHLQSDGDLLIHGDVNPGARISAAGHVMIWGRLRGVAHAGRDGNCEARIVALQLRPLQLRIAEVVARGPDELPQLGLVEQARLEQGEIVIEAAPPEALSSR